MILLKYLDNYSGTSAQPDAFFKGDSEKTVSGARREIFAFSECMKNVVMLIMFFLCGYEAAAQAYAAINIDCKLTNKFRYTK